MSVDYAKPWGFKLAGSARTRSREAMPNTRRLSAELVGAYLLTLAATAPDVLEKATAARFSDPMRAIMPGIAVAIIVYAIGDVSGAHLNPAVTVAFWLRRAFPITRVPGYIAAQLMGAVLASLTLRAAFGPVGKLGANSPKTDLPTAFACEVLLTTILVTVILNVSTKELLIGPQAAIPVGFAIALDGLLGLHVSGGSMNPARSLAPALVSGHLSHLDIYVVGPLVGALVGTAITWLLHGRYEADEKIAAQGDH